MTAVILQRSLSLAKQSLQLSNITVARLLLSRFSVPKAGKPKEQPRWRLCQFHDLASKITLFLPYFVGQKRQKPQSGFQGRKYRIHLLMGRVWVIWKKNIWKIHSATGKWLTNSKYIDTYMQSSHYNCSKAFIVLMIMIL